MMRKIELLLGVLFCYHGGLLLVEAQEEENAKKCFATRDELVKAVDEYMGEGENA